MASSSGTEFHPESWYRDYLLDAFAALGPKVRTSAVYLWLSQHLRPMLYEGDFGTVNNKRSERWWHFVHWNRQRFTEEGLVHPGRRANTAQGAYVSRHGWWELTEKGKRLIEARKSGQPT